MAIGKVSWALVLTLGMIVALGLVSLALNFSFRDNIRDFARGETASLEDAVGGDLDTLLGIGLLTSLATLGAAALTMLWMWRMATNSVAMGRVGDWKPSWAIWGWFVPPCVLYVIPYLMLKDLWRASADQVEINTASPGAVRVPVLIHAWWLFYGLVPLISVTLVFGRGVADRNQSVRLQARRFEDDFLRQTVLSISTLLAAVAFIMIVRQLSVRHRRLTGEQNA